MNKAIVYILMLSFIILFSLGFFTTPWISILSFVPLLAAAIFLFGKRYIKK